MEAFILDRTLSPAIESFGYQEARLIDPTCGSGHFLLGAFHRLLDLHAKAEPGTNPRELVRRVSEQVYGVDLNPFAVGDRSVPSDGGGVEGLRCEAVVGRARVHVAVGGWGLAAARQSSAASAAVLGCGG